jgi:hypothetical protein
MIKITLNLMVQEVGYELKKRRDVYPRLVSSGKERQTICDYHMELMEGVDRTLRWLRDNEALVREIRARGDNAALQSTDELVP